jgi:DNA-binding response OmpR family regulator
MAVVLVSTDLMASSRIEGAAARLGVPLRTSANLESAGAIAAEGPVELLIIDLAALKSDVAAGVQLVRGGAKSPVRILAFGPHVLERLLIAAKEAGCDEVLTRGQFFAGLDAILATGTRPSTPARD